MESDKPCAVAARNVEKLREAVGGQVELYELGFCPAGEKDSVVWVISDRPE